MAENQAVILDSNIIIELYKGNKRIRKRCESIGEQSLYISEISVAEIYFGALNKKEVTLIQKHLDKFPWIPVNENISNIFTNLMIEYSLSHKPYIGDMLIAATAIYYDIHLYTLNIKDFKFINGLKLY
ncbi:MAG: type II toxin-antitoxin system VapC family toxin [Bacteroidota bacterium]